MKVNGKEIFFEQITTIKELLASLNINENRVVVELNKEIIAKDMFSKITLKDEDAIEVISFVGGG